MADYNEVTNSAYQIDTLDPMFHWDARFPERLSRLHLNPEYSCSPLGSRKQTKRPRDRGVGRYKTQPITFDEITEVDEDATAASSVILQTEVNKDVKANFRNQMVGFSRSMDGLGFLPRKVAGATSSQKENSPFDIGEADQGTICSSQEPSERRNVNNKNSSVDGPIVSSFDDTQQYRRNKSNRKLRNRNTVEEDSESEKIEELTSLTAQLM